MFFKMIEYIISRSSQSTTSNEVTQNINQSILTFTFSFISTENVSGVTATVVATINVDTVVFTGVSIAGALILICQLSGNTSRFTHLTKQQL